MARQRSLDRDKAFEIYKEHKGNIELVEISNMLNRPEGTIRGWKNKDKWDNKLNGTFQKKIRNVPKEKANAETKNIKPIVKEVESVLENTELNDKQRLFCLYYVKSFNATKSYQKAYGVDYTTAASIAYRLLENDGVKEEIYRLKKNKLNQAFLEPSDIFQKYMDIAFADVTDFLEFGREEIPVMSAFGPVTVKDKETGEEIQLTKMVNTVKFKESTEVDGTIISEVKQGKDGASIKLADRMKALQWLSDHMDMATEEQRLRCEKLRAEIEKTKDNSENTQQVVIIDDI